MKALCWHVDGDDRVDSVTEPELESPSKVILKFIKASIHGGQRPEADKTVRGEKYGCIEIMLQPGLDRRRTP